MDYPIPSSKTQVAVFSTRGSSIVQVANYLVWPTTQSEIVALGVNNTELWDALDVAWDVSLTLLISPPVPWL